MASYLEKQVLNQQMAVFIQTMLLKVNCTSLGRHLHVFCFLILPTVK